MEKARYQREKDQRIQRAAERYEEHGYDRRRAWEWRMEREYGLTPESYAHMFYVKQEEKCAVCGTAEAGRWCIDHCHETGVVRGILCIKCNTALGMADDSADRLLDLLNYLGKS